MKDLKNIISDLNDARTIAMKIAVGASIDGNVVKETNASILYDKIEEAYLYAIKLKRSAEES